MGFERFLPGPVGRFRTRTVGIGRPVGPLANPARNQLDLGGRQRLAFVLGRHRQFGVGAVDDFRTSGWPRGRPGRSPFRPNRRRRMRFRAVQPQPALLALPRRGTHGNGWSGSVEFVERSRPAHSRSLSRRPVRRSAGRSAASQQAQTAARDPLEQSPQARHGRAWPVTRQGNGRVDQSHSRRSIAHYSCPGSRRLVRERLELDVLVPALAAVVLQADISAARMILVGHVELVVRAVGTLVLLRSTGRDPSQSLARR